MSHIYKAIYACFQTYILHTRKSEIYNIYKSNAKTKDDCDESFTSLVNTKFSIYTGNHTFSFYEVHGFVRSLSCCPHLCSADRPIKRHIPRLVHPIWVIMCTMYACIQIVRSAACCQVASPCMHPPYAFWKQLVITHICICLREWMLQWSLNI